VIRDGKGRKIEYDATGSGQTLLAQHIEPGRANTRPISVAGRLVELPSPPAEKVPACRARMGVQWFSPLHGFYVDRLTGHGRRIISTNPFSSAP